jgi:hypothetical protein
VCGVRRDEVFLFFPFSSRSFFSFLSFFPRSRARSGTGTEGGREEVRCGTGGGARIIHLIRRVRACDLLRRCVVLFGPLGAFPQFRPMALRGLSVERNLS